MNFGEFLKELDRLSIRIFYTEGKLSFEGPEKNITPEIIALLKEFKGNLIRHFWPVECVNMMPVNPLGTKIPFTMIYFEIMNYALSEYFGKDQPFYGFLHFGSKGERIRYENVESYAADYVKQLQKIVPNGPYFLGGFSFGGMLAFEMAIQLQRAGHEVPFLAMLDSKTAHMIVKPQWHDNIFKIIKSNILGPLSRKIPELGMLFICWVSLMLNRPVPVNFRTFYIGHIYRKLTLKYQPGRYDGEILLFRADTAHPEFKYNGWERYANSVRVINFTGGHLSIARQKEYALLIGEEFRKHLDRVYKPQEMK
jgi:thioesterase domain-containing protein